MDTRLLGGARASGPCAQPWRRLAGFNESQVVISLHLQP